MCFYYAWSFNAAYRLNSFNKESIAYYIIINFPKVKIMQNSEKTDIGYKHQYIHADDVHITHIYSSYILLHTFASHRRVAA